MIPQPRPARLHRETDPGTRSPRQPGSAAQGVRGPGQQANEQLKIAKINLDRQENLVRDKLAVRLPSLMRRHNTMPRNGRGSRESGLAKSENSVTQRHRPDGMTFKAPVKGMLQNLHAQIGQPVPAGARSSSPLPRWTRSGSGCRSMLETWIGWRPIGRPAWGAWRDPSGECPARPAGHGASLGRSPGGDGPHLVPGGKPRPGFRPGSTCRCDPPIGR